jgi:hypothetical protein
MKHSHLRVPVQNMFNFCVIVQWLSSFPDNDCEDIIFLYSGEYGNHCQCRFFSHESYVPY